MATIPIGCADGLWRSSSKANLVVKIEDYYVPVIGHICMDQCMVDITNTRDIYVASDVVIYGKSQQNSIDVIVAKNSTINYAIVCALGERVPRVYISKGRTVFVTDSIVR